MTFDKHSLPFLTTAAAVSSQELSIESIKTSSLINTYSFVISKPNIFQCPSWSFLTIHVTGAAPLRDPVLCSWNLQAGADLRVLPGVRIYLSPALTRYLNHSAYAVSWDERSNFSLRAGLSFDLK